MQCCGKRKRKLSDKAGQALASFRKKLLRTF